jgi:hypothetical protein
MRYLPLPAPAKQTQAAERGCEERQRGGQWRRRLAWHCAERVVELKPAHSVCRQQVDYLNIREPGGDQRANVNRAPRPSLPGRRRSPNR